jgi:hypothetical protein
MSNFRVRLTDLRAQARELITAGHISNDIITCIEGLLNATIELERMLGSAEGGAGDLRVLKSRNELLTKEVRAKENEFNAFKKSFLEIVITEIKNISAENAKIQAANQADPDEAVTAGSRAIGQSLRTLAESLTKPKEKS